MRILGYHQIADYIYEVVTESAKLGRVTRKVLVLPNSAMQFEQKDRSINYRPD